MAEALLGCGIVHRDVNPGNILCGADGHLKLIDFQFAIDRNNYREMPFMLQNPVYRYFKFGNCESLGIGEWNDIKGLGLIFCLDRFAPSCADVKARLTQLAESATFSVKPSILHHFRLRLYYLSILLQNAFKDNQSVKWRIKKTSKLMGTL